MQNIIDKLNETINAKDQTILELREIISKIENRDIPKLRGTPQSLVEESNHNYDPDRKDWPL